jgi:hypothetical protein
MSKIAVDVEFLAKVLGVEIKDIRDYMLQNWRQCYAARAITDAFRPYQPGNKIVAEISLKNAEAWINNAYRDGVAAGVAMERKEWESKVLKLFGIKT